jgi:pimeloyl-ACP methyl ester carboxylesterase
MINLQEIGSFFVGGRELVVSGAPVEQVKLSADAIFDHDPNGTYWIESAYVQFYRQVEPCFETPILLVHGGGRTGTIWESTADGRTGWLTRLLEVGMNVFVIDNVERGRAGFCCFDGEWEGKPIVRSAEEAWTMNRFGTTDAQGTRIENKGQQFPIQALSTLSAQAVPRWPSTAKLQQQALVEAVRRIGPVVLLSHSQGGGLSFHAADQARDLVRACIMLEPHGMPMQFAPGLPSTPALLVLGDFIDESDYWVRMREKHRQSLAAWQAAGGRSELWALPAKGLCGNTHMIMMDRNSDQVANLLIDWLKAQQAAGSFA